AGVTSRDELRISVPELRPWSSLRGIFLMASSRLNSRWIALLVASGVIFYLCWLMMRPFVDVLMWGIVLAMLSYPAFARLVGRGRSRQVSALLTTALVVVTILLPLT